MILRREEVVLDSRGGRDVVGDEDRFAGNCRETAFGVAACVRPSLESQATSQKKAP